MSKPTLITGASGFLGRHLVEELRARPNRPALRIFNYGPCPWENGDGIEVLEGNIMKAGEVDRAMEGCGQVYHLAGAVSRDPRDDQKMFDIHVGGATNICEAALKHRPEKIVAVSSSGTIAVSKNANDIFDEAAPYPDELIEDWAYYVSKVEAEKVVRGYVRDRGLPIVTANPALLLGPGDELGSSTGDVALFLEGQIMALPLGGMCFVDARDAAHGLVLAMEKGRIGERYLLGGPNWEFKKIIQAVAEIAGKRAPSLQPPLGFSLWSARLLRRLMPLIGKQFKMDDVSIIMSAHYWYFTSAKAERELGFNARDPLETIRATVEDIQRRKK